MPLLTTTNNSNNGVRSARIKKAISIIFFLTVFYIVPLSFKPWLLLNWQVILLSAICTILFITQPRLSLKESKSKRETDKNTVLLICTISGLGQIISLMEWAYLGAPSQKLSITMGAGIFLLISGTAFRLYSIHVLGKYFSATVQIKNDHRIISSGPYKYLRHPSYTGAYIAMLGCALFLGSLSGIIIFGIGMLFVYHLRIKNEEQTLTRNFREAYISYSRSTWKMFPYIW